MTVEPPRIAALDGLRGVAVMGILLMNIVAFAMPEAAYFNPVAYGGERGADIAVWAVNAVLTDGKMRGLFSLLFGASMLLVIQRAEAAGEHGAKVHLRRMAWLLVFGLVHFYLIWWGDILFQYAVIGIVALLFVHHDTRQLVRWGALFFAIQLLVFAILIAGMMSLRHEAGLPGADAATVDSWREIVDSLGRPGVQTIIEQLAIHRGGYADIVGHKLSEMATDPLFYLAFGGAETLGLMLFGMAGLKSGFLTGSWPRARYRRIALIGYAIGLPPMIALVAFVVASDFDPLAIFGALLMGATPFRPILTAAHAALLLLWLGGEASPLKIRAAAAGRAAFSNYIGTSLVMTTIFYGYGFSLYGDIGRAALYLFVLGMWALILLWSKPWLDRFAYGPLEWLWRSLARGSLQPMPRSAIAKQSH